MNTRVLRILVGLGLGVLLLSASTSSQAMRIPTRPVEPIYIDNDPHVPDTKQPARTIVKPEFVLLEDTRAVSPARPAEPARHESWMVRILRILNRLRFGGLVR